MSSSSTQLEELLGQPLGLPHLVIRTVQPKDIQGLADILADSFHSRTGLMQWIYPLLRMGIYEDLRNRIRNKPPGYICLVAVKSLQQPGTNSSVGQVQGDLAGTVEMALRYPCPWQRPKSNYLYLSNLAVRREYRRQGVAQQLLITCERVALHWGYQDIYLHVLKENTQARNLYHKRGYRLHQTEPNWLNWLFKQPDRLFLHKHLNPSHEE